LKNLWKKSGFSLGRVFGLAAAAWLSQGFFCPEKTRIQLDPVDITSLRMGIADTAALLPVVTEAGGTLTDWAGNATHAAPEAVATNGRLLEAVMRHLRG
jgi:hypothetical protein